MRTQYIRLVSPVFLAAVLLTACSNPSPRNAPQESTQAAGQAATEGAAPSTPVPQAVHTSVHTPADSTASPAGTGSPVVVTGMTPANGAAGHDPVDDLVTGISTASDLREVLDLLLTEHVLLEASATGAILSLSQAGYTAAAEALEANTLDLSYVLQAVYGPQLAMDFLPVWRKHIGYMVGYTTALAAHDRARIEEALSVLLGSSAELSGFFHAANPNLSEENVSTLFETHMASLKQVIDMQEANNPGLFFAALREARAHMGMISREITAGIAAQFPDRFPGELAAPPAELRSRLTLLLSEHIYLAASATRAVLKGRQLEFEAAAGMIDLNSIDLAAAIGSSFGREAQDAFLPMWRKHVGLADEYTISLASNDTSGQRTALAKLLAYPAELGAFLNTLNPDIPEDALAGLEEDHIRSLIEIIDSQNVGNEATASNLLRQAYAHTGMMAALLAEGILPPSASANDQAGMVMQVEISVFAFVPAEIEVKVGTTVIWTNQDETVHTVTSGTIDNAGGDFDSAPFNKGQSFAFLFTTPGDYSYFCRVHPEMVGLVRVVP